jgi:hypothetical protein
MSVGKAFERPNVLLLWARVLQFDSDLNGYGNMTASLSFSFRLARFWPVHRTKFASSMQAGGANIHLYLTRQASHLPTTQFFRYPLHPLLVDGEFAVRFSEPSLRKVFTDT